MKIRPNQRVLMSGGAVGRLLFPMPLNEYRDQNKTEGLKPNRKSKRAVAATKKAVSP